MNDISPSQGPSDDGPPYIDLPTSPLTEPSSPTNPSSRPASGQSTAATPTKTHDIAETSAADLVVQLATEEDEIIHYNVCRSVLTHASPVFSKLVDKRSRLPSTRKRKRNEDDANVSWFLDLHDDDPHSLLLMFQAFHLQTHLLPATIRLKELLSVAMTCDKYDCVRAMSPFVKPWLDHWHQRVLEDGHEAWLTICVIFGEKRHFWELSKALAQEGSLREVKNEPKFYRNEKVIEMDQIPDNVFDAVIAKSRKASTRMHSIMYGFLRQFEEQEGAKCSQTCRGTFYGNLAVSARLRYRSIWDFINLDPLDLPRHPERLPSPKALHEGISRIMDPAHSACEIIHPYYAVRSHQCPLRDLAYETLSNIRTVSDVIPGLVPEKFVRKPPTRAAPVGRRV